MSEEVMEQVVIDKPKKAKRVKKKKSLTRKIIEGVFFGIFGALFVFIVAGNISGEIHKEENFGQSIRFGVGSFIVLTNSMEPEIAKDSALITYKEEVKDIYSRVSKGKKVDVTFANIGNNATAYVPKDDFYKPENGGRLVITNRVMTHRIVEMQFNKEVKYGYGRYIFVAAGINPKGYQSGDHQYQVFTEKEYLGTVKVHNQFLGKVFNFIVSPVGLIILLLVPAAYLIVVSSIDIFKTLKTSEEQEKSVSEAPTGGKLAQASEADRERLKKELLEELKNKRKE